MRIHEMLAVAALLVMTSGCALKRVAINKLGDSLAQSGTTFTADDDPDLVAQALPFGLKLYEGLLAESPRHRGLLFAAAKGFTSYAYAFVHEDADEMEDVDLAKATALRARARRLYLRARDYGIRGLETRHRDFGKALRADPKTAVVRASKGDVPMLYWTAAAWGLAISVSKDNPELIADQPVVEALIDRALALQEDFELGAIHSFLIGYESSRAGGGKDSDLRARRHFDQAMKLSGGTQAGPLVSLAENVSLSKQDRREFEDLLTRALRIDADANPDFRLTNLVMQRRARWLLGRADQIFAR
ncbi:MAG: TRAP transporter TatT component family protein [Bryobacteraceae bacterium]